MVRKRPRGARGRERLHDLVVAATAVAGELLGEGGELACEEGVDCVTHGCILACEVDIYAHLFEAHERTEPHTAGKQSLHTVACEVLHRSKAAALLMGHVFQRGNGLDGVVFDFHKRVDVAMTKMHAHRRIEPARQPGRNGKQITHDKISIFWSWTRGLAAHAQVLKGRPHVLQAIAQGIMAFGQGLTADHDLSHQRIEGERAEQGMPVRRALRGDGRAFLCIEIRLVDDDGQRDAEMTAELNTILSTLRFDEG